MWSLNWQEINLLTDLLYLSFPRTFGKGSGLLRGKLPRLCRTLWWDFCRSILGFWGKIIFRGILWYITLESCHLNGDWSGKIGTKTWAFLLHIQVTTASFINFFMLQFPRRLFCDVRHTFFSIWMLNGEKWVISLVKLATRNLPHHLISSFSFWIVHVENLTRLWKFHVFVFATVEIPD